MIRHSHVRRVTGGNSKEDTGMPGSQSVRRRAMPDGKQPYAIARADGKPLMFAGLWGDCERQRATPGGFQLSIGGPRRFPLPPWRASRSALAVLRSPVSNPSVNRS